MKSFEQLLEPSEIIIQDKTFYISKFDAVGGREIVCNYLNSNIPKIGSYKLSEEMMLKLMNYVAIKTDAGTNQVLLTKDLINSQLNGLKSPWEALVRIEAAMIEYNCSFFQNGRVSTFLEDVALKVPPLITKMLTDSLGQLLQKEEQPSTNSEPSTH
jgi:hypothetical protein